LVGQSDEALGLMLCVWLVSNTISMEIGIVQNLNVVIFSGPTFFVAKSQLPGNYIWDH
jgi:hypothetical protein